MRTPDMTVDDVSVTHTIGGQLDLGKWTDEADNTKRLTVTNKIINLRDPDEPQDAATRSYVDRRIRETLSGTTGDGDPNGVPGIQGVQGPPGIDGPLGRTGSTGQVGPPGPIGIPGIAGPTGLDGKFAGRGDTGYAGPAGPAGPAGSRGLQGDRGATGELGPQGIQGSSGLILYLNPSGDSLTDTTITDSYLMSTVNANFSTRVLDYSIYSNQTRPLTYFWNLRKKITQAQFAIPGGEVWSLNLFAKPLTGSDANNIGLTFKLFRITSTTTALASSILVDVSDGAVPPVALQENVISVGTVSSMAVIDSTAIKLYKMSLEVPFTDISDEETYLQIQIYATNLSSPLLQRTHSCRLYFQNTPGGYTEPLTGVKYSSTYSYVRTSLGAAGIQGPLGQQGAQGDRGQTGSQGLQGYQGEQGEQGDQGEQGPAGIRGLRGDAAGPIRSVQYKDPATDVLMGTDLFRYHDDDNGGTLVVPNITMTNMGETDTGPMITPHRVDTVITDLSAAPLYLNTGSYGGTDNTVGFLTVGIKSTNPTVHQKTGAGVDFGFKTFYGLQTINPGYASAYAYRLSRCDGGAPQSSFEVQQNGARIKMNADRFLLSSSSGNSNSAAYTLHDIAGPNYDLNNSYILSTRVWDQEEDDYPVWMSCHRGTSTGESTGAMIKMSPSEIRFMGAVTFSQGMQSAGALVNLNTDVSGTMNLGASAATVNLATAALTVNMAPVATTLNMGTGAATLNMGTGAATINIGTDSSKSTVINIGGAGDTVNVAGTLTYVNTVNMEVLDSLITLNKGAAAAAQSHIDSGIQIYNHDSLTGVNHAGSIKTSTSGTAWTIVPPISAGPSVNAGNGLTVCSLANTKSTTDVSSTLIGLQSVKSAAVGAGGPNLVFKQDGSVGIGYKSASAATVDGFPLSPLHIEDTGGNQIVLGNGNNSGTNQAMRLFLKSPCATNGNLIMAVGTATSTTRSSTAELITDGLKLKYDNLALTLNWNSSSTSSTSPPAVTFTRSDGSTLFSYDVYIDSSKYFRMYSGAKSSDKPSFEIDGTNGATRLGLNTTADASGGSLVLGSHLILNADSVAATPTSLNRPTGAKGLIRFNDTNNSAEIYDGSYWVDVGYYSGLPLGAIIAYPSATVPSTAFKLCNGELLSKTADSGKYADLFTIIGYTYSATNSGDTFKLPDIQGRTIVGSNAATFTLGGVGGAETHKLTVDEMPAHKHTVAGPSTFAVSVSGKTDTSGSHSHIATDSGHTHYSTHSTNSQWVRGDWDQVSAVEPFYSQKAETSIGKAVITVDASGSHTHDFSGNGTATITYSADVTLGLGTTNTGGIASHNNLQPYIVLNYFIKVVRDSKRYTSTTTASDIRVKRNIVPLNADQAIVSIRGLQPKRYEYIDRNISEFAQHIGFIAQEVKLCIPESVRTKREYIPNIYSMAKLTTSEKPGNALLTSVQHPMGKLIKEQLLLNLDSNSCTSLDTNISIKGTKLKMFNKSKECFYVCCVESIDEYNIMVEPLDAVTTAKILSADYFVYGQEIEDYHYMNSDAVFSTLVSAFQALDQKCNQQEILLNAIISKYGLTLAS
jgi:microcystin-dependent protein